MIIQRHSGADAGNPVISSTRYTGGTGGGRADLQLVHCNDPNCAGTDETAPVISVPESPVIVTAAPGAATAIVAFDVSATDDHDGVVPVTCTPASGTEFPLGTRVVTCTATDAADNAATARFSVTVQPSPADTLPPTGGDPTTSILIAGLLIALGSTLFFLVRYRQIRLP